MNELRNKRQIEFAEKWLSSDRKNILLLAPRFGKIFTSINIFERMGSNISILICYPDIKIKTSWQIDFLKREYNDSNVTYTTYLSLKKHTNKIFDIIVLDECHTLSSNQIEECKLLFANNKTILALTGTLSFYTEKTLMDELSLPILIKYDIEQAIEEGVIVDYQINIVKVSLDNVQKKEYKGKFRTEKKQFDHLTWIIDKMQNQGRDTMFMRLARMRIIQNSLAKRNKTIELLKKFKDLRTLTFCGTIDIADSLGVESFHSKSEEKKAFQDFADGIGNHLAVVKIGGSGVTFKPLNHVIINYFSSSAEDITQRINRCMGIEYNNPDKKASIWIISSNEEIELKWLNKALSMFNPEKIKYL